MSKQTVFADDLTKRYFITHANAMIRPIKGMQSLLLNLFPMILRTLSMKGEVFVSVERTSLVKRGRYTSRSESATVSILSRRRAMNISKHAKTLKF